MVLACCGIVVIVLGVLFHGQTGPDVLDHAVDAPVIGWLGGHQSLALRLAYPGSVRPAVVLSATIVVACLLTRRINGGVLAVAAVPAAVGLNDGLLKPLVHRTLTGFLSYPSGHTAAVSAIAATVTILLLVPPQPARFTVPRVLIATVAWVLPAVVAIGLIGLQWHYFTDIMAGAAVGIGTVCGLALVLDLVLALLAQALTAP
jgi:membrane-associated phospholipid phosphatase